jgi:hypothetical protein
LKAFEIRGIVKVHVHGMRQTQQANERVEKLGKRRTDCRGLKQNNGMGTPAAKQESLPLGGSDLSRTASFARRRVVHASNGSPVLVSSIEPSELFCKQHFAGRTRVFGKSIFLKNTLLIIPDPLA